MLSAVGLRAVRPIGPISPSRLLLLSGGYCPVGSHGRPTNRNIPTGGAHIFRTIPLGLTMSLRGIIALAVAVALSLISAIIIGIDLDRQKIKGNMLTTALFDATAASWIIWCNARTREAVHGEVDKARQELHASHRVRHLRSVLDDG